jgi:hypothetical protein
VLHTLDALNGKAVEDGTKDGGAPSSSPPVPLFSSKRPVCLWDPRHAVEETHRTDEWGRSVEFTRTSNQTEYVASKERYYKYDDAAAEDVTTAAVSLWADFCRVHWPHNTTMEETTMAGTTLTTATATTTTATTTTIQGKTSAKARTNSVKHLFVDRQLRLAVAG